MSMTLKEQAWQSGLVLLNETPEWNEHDWPPLMGGWRRDHTTVVLDHPAKNDNNNHRGQAVVVLGGFKQGQGVINSILVLNLAESNMQWREGSPMNKSRRTHAAVVCNGAVYVMGGYNGVMGKYNGGTLDCIERIDANDLLQLSLRNSTTHESLWTTLNCRLSTERRGCSAVAVHNQYIVVMGGCDDGYLPSVDIIDSGNHTLIFAPSMTVPRSFCASVVVGHRIFVVGGCNEHGNLDSVEYLDFTRPCDNRETEKDTTASVISFSSTWITHSHLVLSNARSSCAMVAVGSCLVVAGGRGNPTVEVLDMHRNHVWNLLPFTNYGNGCSMVTVANQVAVIGGWGDPSCATLPLMDRKSWCFQRLCEQPRNEWDQFREGMGIRDADVSRFSTSTSARKRATPSTQRGDSGKDES